MDSTSGLQDYRTTGTGLTWSRYGWQGEPAECCITRPGMSCLTYDCGPCVCPYFESTTCVLFIVLIVREEQQKDDELCSTGYLMDFDRQMSGQNYTTQGRFHHTSLNRVEGLTSELT